MVKYLTFGSMLMLILASQTLAEPSPTFEKPRLVLQITRRVHTVDVAITLATAIGTRPPSGAAGEVLLEVLAR